MPPFCPGIPFVTEYLLADRWYKGLDDQPTDESGRIVPYKITAWQTMGNTAGGAQLLLRRSVAAGVRLLAVGCYPGQKPDSQRPTLPSNPRDRS